MIKAILLKIFVFIFCVFFAELLHAGNPSIIDTNQGKDFKIINPLLSSVALRLNTYASFKRIFQATSAVPPTYSKHYIAPAPWQYWSKANQIIITTESTTTISGTITKSDGTLLFNFTCSAGVPYIQRFIGLPGALPIHPLNTVVNDGGLIVTADGSISVNLRNIASDQLGSDGNDANIKGNASLFSFGDAGIGTSFRVGYYRDGNLAGNERPTYSIMALENNTIIKIAGAAVTTLNAGQSYLFQCPIGTLIESSGAAVMNTSARLDAPGGCGDGAYNPIPPIASLGSEYVIVRGEGNLTAEQTTIVSTEPNTKIRVEFFDENGVQQSFQDITITAAGGFKTFNHGWINGTYDKNNNTGRFSSSRIVSDKNILVFSGTGGVSGGGGCEVDVATLVPIASCAGSKQVETYKFTSYKDGNLPYFGYILTKNTDKIYLTTKGTTPYTSKDIESITGIGPRKALGTSGLYLIKFTDANISYPNVITINSTSRLTVSMVQQSSDFSMSNFISRFPEKAEQPGVDLTDCAAAKLTAGSSINDFYKWFLNGVEIAGATSKTYTATVSGNYTVSLNLECGLSAQSIPLTISLCNIDRSIEKKVDIALPEIDQVVTFTLKAKNLGTGNAIGVSVTDLLPSGYSYVSNTVSEGNYNPTTGLWTIGSMPAGGEATLLIKAKVVSAGTHRNNASITGTQADNNVSNDNSWAETSTTPGEITLVSIGSPDRSVCVNTQMDAITYSIGGGASGAEITGLPSGVTSSYDETTKTIKIAGIPTVATPPEGIEYTVTTTGGIRVSKTGRIIVKREVGIPVFAAGLTSARCAGSGNDTYTATSSDSESIIYSLAPAESGSIDPSTGVVTWAVGYTGPAKITARAIGCSEKISDFPVMVYQRPGQLSFNDIIYCRYQTALPLTASLNGNKLIWYDRSGNRLADGYIPSTLNAGSTDFYVSQENSNGCESDKTKVVVTINVLPSAPSVTPLTYCQNEQNIQSLTATGSNLTWYDANGTALPGAPTPVTTTVGVTSYFVTQKNSGGCESPKAELKVTINALPDAPATTDLKYCQNQPNIQPLTATGSNLTWYDANGTALSGAPTPVTSNVGITSYYVTQKNNEGCESPKSELKVTVNALPDAPATLPLSYCQNQTNIPALTATASANASLIWYNEAGTLLASAPSPSTTIVGEQKFYVSQKFTTGCEGPKALLTVTINALPLAPATTDLKYCQNQTNILALTATASSGAGLIWYNEAGTLLASAPTPSTVTVGEQKFYVSQKFATGCEGPKALLTVTIDALPNAPITQPLSYCQNQTNIPALTATASANASLIWYNEAGTLLVSAPSPSTAIVGEQKFYVSQKFATGCEGPKALLTVTINALPNAPATTDLKYCQNQTNIPALTATASSGAGLIWYNEAGTLLASAPTPSTATVGEQKFYVSQKFATGCEGPKALLTVTINALPNAPVTASLSYCQNQTNIPALTATASANASLIWYNEAGTLLASAPTPSTVTVGEQKFYVSQKFATGCEGPKALLTVTINVLPNAPAITNLTYCQNQTNIPTLTATASSGASLIWYNEVGTLLSSAPTPSTATVGEQKFYVSQKFATGCEGPKALLTVTINALPLAPVTASLSYCQNQTNILALTAAASSGASLIWYNEAGTLLSSAPTPSTVTVGEQKFYVSQKFATGCEGPKALLTVTINALPPAPTMQSLSYCQNQPNTQPLTATGSNLTWYDANGIILPGAPVPTTSTVGIINYYVSQTNLTGCESAKSKITVEVFAAPEKPTISASGSVVICEGGSVILKSNPSVNYQWFKDGEVLSGAVGQALTVSETGLYKLITKNANGCGGEFSEGINVLVNKIAQKPIIQIQGASTVCEGQTVVLSSSYSTGNQWFKDGVLIPGATEQTYLAKLTGKYTLVVNTSSGCSSKQSDPVAVSVNSMPVVPVITTQSSMLICKGGVATLTSSISSGNQWYKNGALIPGATGPVYIANSTGSYTVKSKNVSGCESLNSNAINLAEEEFKIALQTSSNRVEYGSKIELSTSSKLGYKILSWSPANIFIEGGAKSQSFMLLNNITVTVNAVSDNGCYASATVNIQVDKKRDLFIPNTFTPNGDGKNDVIKVYGTGIEMIYWAVYSQWGQLIYKSKAQDASWDGTFGGVMQPVGVYVYKCVIRFTDGEEITKHGAINLVR